MEAGITNIFILHWDTTRGHFGKYKKQRERTRKWLEKRKLYLRSTECKKIVCSRERKTRKP